MSRCRSYPTGVKFNSGLNNCIKVKLFLNTYLVMLHLRQPKTTNIRLKQF